MHHSEPARPPLAPITPMMICCTYNWTEYSAVQAVVSSGGFCQCQRSNKPSRFSFCLRIWPCASCMECVNLRFHHSRCCMRICKYPSCLTRSPSAVQHAKQGPRCEVGFPVQVSGFALIPGSRFADLRPRGEAMQSCQGGERCKGDVIDHSLGTLWEAASCNAILYSSAA